MGTLVSTTVLIAAADHLPTLADRADLAGADVFSDAQALSALEAILTGPAAVVAIDRAFAATSRGAALVHRIKADPSLAACEVRLVAHDSTPPRTAQPPLGDPEERPRAESASALLGKPVLTSASATEVASSRLSPPPPKTPLDYRGTRRAPRINMAADVEVLIDGNPAMLVDASVLGAQVVSPTVLKPNQRVRLWLNDPARPIRFTGCVAWASFEIPKTGPRYRAGIEFVGASPDVMDRFIATHRKGDD